MLREHHKWHSASLNRDMELLVFGHAGARVIVFPTSMGRFFDWESRGLINTLSHHLEQGWIQLYCVDSVDTESWYNSDVSPHVRAARHMQYHDYILKEVLPFTQSKNDNPYLMAIGASFGAYHAVDIALRFPDVFNRAIGMSGIYDIRSVKNWNNGSDDWAIWQSNPCEYIRWLDDANALDKIRQLDLIIPVGHDDPNFGNNQYFSNLLWERGIWHAFRIWDGNAHDWPFWQEMVLHYIGGAETKG